MLEAHTGPSRTLEVTMVTATGNEKCVLKGRSWYVCVFVRALGKVRERDGGCGGVSDTVCLLICV